MMSSDKPPRLLIIDGNADLVQTLRLHFEREENYQVHSAGTGADGLSLAATLRPNLILLDMALPDMEGLDVFRALRDRARTGHIPVMVLAGRSEALLQNKVLEEGAYDFIEKPLDVDILTLRVRNALRRAEREGLTEPRTGLPTGRLLQERLGALARCAGWYKINVQIDSFGVFRDLYGFVTANEALRFAGNLIEQIVHEGGTPDDFVGHPTGSEEFVIITTPGPGPALARQIAERVTDELHSFYSFIERDQGYVLVEDGTGSETRKPLMAARTSTSQGTPDPDAPASSDLSAEDAWVDAVEDEKPPPEESSGGSPFDW